MRLTEALDYYNGDNLQYKSRYSHFDPTNDDIKLRKEYRKNIKNIKLNNIKPHKFMKEFE